MRVWLLVRGTRGREIDGLGNPLMSKQLQQLGPLSEQANGICVCPHLDGCFSEWGQNSPSMVHSLWPEWLREEDTGDEVGDRSNGAVHMDGKSW